MSFKSEHVVVPFAVFKERRELRTRIAAALRARNRSEVAVQGPLVAVVPVTVARGQAPSSARSEQCE